MKSSCERSFCTVLILVLAGTGLLCSAADNSKTSIEAKSQRAVKEGSCGTSCRWSLVQESGVLTISGEGIMSSNPWKKYTTSIKKVIIKNGITEIANDAFRDCSLLESVDIPDSVTSAGHDAFMGCTSLKSIYIPDSLDFFADALFYGCVSLETIRVPNTTRWIGNQVFYGCHALKSFEFPETLTSIHTQAFQSCISLKSVTIPKSVTTLYRDAFSGCTSLTFINISDDNLNYKSIDGVLFNKEGTNLMLYPAGNPRTFYRIPDSVTTIEFASFWYCGIVESIEIPSSVISIGKRVFGYCRSLRSVIIPDSISLIVDQLFEGCESLNSVRIPENITSIGYGAFWYCSSLTTINIPNSVTTIGEYAFNGCNSLESITIPENVTSIGKYAFDDCYALTYINVSDNNSNYKSIDGVLFNKAETELIQYPANNSRTSYKIPDSITSIRYKLFRGCRNLESIEIPSSIISIDYEAFYGCSALKSITIPENVTSIGNNAFVCCSSLPYINVSESNLNFKSVDGVLFNKAGNVLIQYPSGNSRTYYNIPDSVISIKNNAFGCSSALIYINVSESNLNYKSIDGVIYNKTGTELIRYPEGNSRTFYKIPDSVTSVGDYAFFNCENLAEIEIPYSVNMIKYSAFAGCSSLLSMTIPQSVSSIKDNVFSKCSALSHVCFLGTNDPGRSSFNVFEGCISLEKVTVLENYLGDSFCKKTVEKKQTCSADSSSSSMKSGSSSSSLQSRSSSSSLQSRSSSSSLQSRSSSTESSSNSSKSVSTSIMSQPSKWLIKVITYFVPTVIIVYL